MTYVFLMLLSKGLGESLWSRYDVLDNVPGAVCSVACLEWKMRIGESHVCVMAITIAGLPLKYFLQKRLRDGLTVVENT